MKIIKNKYSRTSAADKQSVEAINWFKKIRAENPKPKQYLGLGHWLKRNQAHQESFDRINATWDSLDTVKDHPLVLETLNRDFETAKPTVKKVPVFKRGFRIPVIRYASLMATCLLVAGLIWLPQWNTIPNKSYRTVNGEHRSVQLADDSTVHLDAETSISTFFSKELRRVELKKGQAMFSVAHDPEKPFIVTADGVTVRALGTVFNVHKENRGKVSVSVAEGVVRVDWVVAPDLPIAAVNEEGMEKLAISKQNLIANKKTMQPRTESKVLTSGQKIAVERQKVKYKIQTVKPNQVNAWREGKLVFKERPLVDVINEINRHINNKILIGDKSLEEITISLNFQIKHYEGFLSTLEKTIPIISQTTPDGKHIILRKSG
ncbi:MAG: FecR domain-containing protein [Deltaproteobacteria bacterium]|nr:FecR domain-containing protein [Deltaproteobacteria bacterium]